MTPAQCRAARHVLGWAQLDLALAAGVGTSTVACFETGKRKLNRYSMAKIRSALITAGIDVDAIETPT